MTVTILCLRPASTCACQLCAKAAEIEWRMRDA